MATLLPPPSSEPPPPLLDTSIPASIGIIVPPEKTMKIIHQTANYVARQGPHVEEDILSKATGAMAHSFTFLLEDSPFHAYYLKRVEDVLAGRTDHPAPAQPAGASAQSAAPAQPKVIAKAAVVRALSLADMVRASARKKSDAAPPPLAFLLAHPLDASPLTIELIKLTAQRVAVEGKRLESDLLHRRTGELGFMQSPHPHHEYYSSLLASYRRILGRDSSAAVAEDARVQAMARSGQPMLDAVLQRLAHRRAELAKTNPEDARLKDRQDFLDINWHDFVVVETITLDSGPPTRVPPSEPVMTTTTASAADKVRPVFAPLGAQERDDDEDGPVNLQPSFEATGVRPSASEPMAALPDGRLVPVSELNAHMKTELQSSKWRENQDKFESKNRTTNTEHGAAISINLAKMAGVRPDVFGGKEEDALRRAEELKRREREKIVWDGSAFTANAAKQAVELQAEIAAQAKPVVYQKSVPIAPLIQPPARPPEPVVAAPPPPPPQQQQQPKRARVEGAEPGTVDVMVPAGGPNGLGPCVVHIKTASAAMEVAAFKELVSKELQGVAVGRFQLVDAGKFLKNTDVLGANLTQVEIKWKVK